jgi:sarcosine oxidase subunit beta
MPDIADVVVIGGGCAGSSISWQLAKQGAGRIVQIEKSGIAAGATGWSSAIIRQHYTHETLARMALRALRVYQNFGDVVGGDAGFRQTGFLVLVGPADAETLAANVAMHRQVGINARMVAPDDLGQFEPRAARDDVGAVAWEPEAGYADPVSTTNGYAAAARRLGVDQRIGTTVTGLRVESGRIVAVETDKGTIESRAVVVAAGYRTRELLAPLGFDVPLTPVRHPIAIVQRTPGFGAAHPIVSDRINGAYYRPEGAELTLIGTTAADDGRIDPEIDAVRLPTDDEQAALIERFCLRFPTEGAATLRPGYTGVYDCSPDLQPMLGPVPGVEGLHIAVGFSGHGFKLSPVVGELVAEKVLTGRTSFVDIGFFSPARFEQQASIVSTNAYTVGTLG